MGGVQSSRETHKWIQSVLEGGSYHVKNKNKKTKASVRGMETAGMGQKFK